MLKTSEDLNTAIEFVTTENVTYPSLIEDRLSSVQFNNSMQNIESQLNELYEKTRLLEDIRDYCKQYILSIIQMKEQDFKEKLKIIEDVADQFRDKDSISYTVPFQYCSDIITDRDGTMINKMNIINGSLGQSYTLIDTAKISNISYTTNAQCYNNNYNDILNGLSGRSYYILDNPIYGGVVENCTVMFDKNYDCNLFNIEVSNTQIKNIKLITDKDTEIPINENDTTVINTIKGLKFDLVSKDYQIKNIEEANNTTDSSAKLSSNNYKRDNLDIVTKNMVIQAESIDKSDNVSEYSNEYYKWKKDFNNVTNKNILVNQVKEREMS